MSGRHFTRFSRLGTRGNGGVPTILDGRIDVCCRTERRDATARTNQPIEIMIRLQYHILTALAAATLVACGGGGGGSSPTEVSATAGPPVTLSEANYETVATEAAAAGLKAVDASTEGSFLTGVATPGEPDWLAIARQRIADWRTLLAASTPIISGATVTDTLACAGGGSLRFTVNDLNGNEAPDAGDNMAITADSCVDNGRSLAGSFTIVLSSAPSGDLNGSVYSVEMLIAFNNLRVSQAGVSYAANGTLALSSERTAPDTGSDTIRSSYFSSSLTVAGSPARTRTLNDLVATVDWTPNETVTTIGAVVTSTALDGKSVQIATPVPFKRHYNASDYPYTGVAVATGANGTVTLTVPSDTSVRIELDIGSDGSIERTIEKDWSTIQ